MLKNQYVMSLYIASFDQLMTSLARSFSKGEGCFHNMSEKKANHSPL